jgi:MFS family permease
MVDRFGKGVRDAPRDALIADSTLEGARGKAFGLHRAMDSLGAAAGVALSIWLVSMVGHNLRPHDYRHIFLISLIPAVLAVAVLLFIREHKKETTARDLPRLSFKLLPAKLKWFLFVVTLFALGNSSNQFLILRAKNVGMSVLAALAAYLLYNAVYSFLSYPAGRLSDRIGRKRLLVAGYAFYGGVYVGFALARRPGFVWLLFALYGVFSALNEGLEKALVADIAPVDQRGTFVGLHSTLTGIGLLPASLLAGGLWSLFGPSAPFWFGGVLGLLAAIGLAIVL